MLSIYVLFLVFSTIRSPVQSFALENSFLTDSGHYPFPEMNRFLNANPRVHFQSGRYSLTGHRSQTVLRYLCSLSQQEGKIEEIFRTFGDNYRRLITIIIKQECVNTYHRRKKRAFKMINRLTTDR